jgi:lipopolysaccharide heptosyltransferase II
MVSKKQTLSLNRILVIRTDRIGDVILSLPTVTALRRRFPRAIISMLVHPQIRPLLLEFPDATRILTDDGAGHGFPGFVRLIRDLRKHRFQTALCLHPTLRLAAALWFARIPLRVGSGYRFYSFFFNRPVFEHRKESTKHEAEYNLSLAAELGADIRDIPLHLPVDPDAEKRIRQRLREMGISGDRPVVVLHPGSRGSAMDWPAERFSQLADRLAETYRARIIMTGSQEEKNWVRRLAGYAGTPVYSLAGELDLKELAALLRQASLVVANSTGPLHIAVAVGTPVIGLYPPFRTTGPGRWGPYRRERSTLTPADFDCGRCKPSRCAAGNCMELITVEQVWELADDKLRSWSVS